MTDKIPTIGVYRGVGLHAFQDQTRLAVVRGDIDDAFALDDAERLFAFAADLMRAPEARLLAAARVKALFELATERREVRPNVDLQLLRAHVAGLDSLRWLDRRHYGTALAPGLAPGERRPMRPYVLTDSDIADATR